MIEAHEARKVQLGEIAEVQWGDTNTTKKAYTASGYPAYSASGPDGYMDHFDHVGPGIVLSAIGARCGMTWLADGQWSCIKNTIYIKSKSGNADTRFLYYATANPDFWPRRGAAQPFISQGDARKCELLLPNFETQQCIAAILGTYDDLIEVNRRRVAVLEEMARGLFEEWFVRFRFPGHEDVPIVDTPDGPLPEGWSIVPLAKLCERITDGAHKSPKSVEVGRPMASVRDMREWGFEYSACRTIGENDWDELVRSDCYPRIGDILIAKDGANLNKHTFLVWRKEPVVLLSSIAIIRPSGDAEREFLTATLRSSKTDAAIKNMKSGAAIPRIVLRDFKRLPVTWPASGVRRAFEDLITPVHQLCRYLIDANQKLAASRDLLLPRLISGQLSVEVAERQLENAA